MRKHGERIEVNFGIKLPINVCTNTECGRTFVLLYVRDNGDVWEQVGNDLGNFFCPYCGQVREKEKSTK